MTERTTFAVVDPDTLETLRRAEIMYRGLADGRLKIYSQEDWRWMKPDLRVARDHAARIKTLMGQLKK